MFVLETVTARWDDGNGVFSKIVCPIHLIACGCDGKAFLKGIDFSNVTEQFAKFQATASQNIHIGTTISENFLLEVEHVIIVLQISIPM
jgi:hypothetical protein